MSKNFDIPVSNGELSDLIGQIYDAGLTGQWTALLDQVIDITQSNKAFIYLQKLSSQNPLLLEFQANFEYSADVLNDFYGRTFEDPYYQVIKTEVEGESINLNKRIKIHDHKGTHFYDNIIVPMKSFQAFGGVLLRDGVHDSLFATNRGIEDPPYSEQDFNLFQLMTPHLSRAVQTFKKLRLYKNYANISKSILDQTDKGIMVCDKLATITLCNEYADKKVKELPEFICTDGKLKLQDEMLNRQLAYYLRECASLSYNGIGRQQTIFLDKPGQESIQITVSPLKDRNRFNDLDASCCLVTIELKRPMNWNAVIQEFGLTAREQQLLRAIYNKKKLSDLSELFGVSYNTLRTHLQSIFRKADVNSQTELMIRISQFLQA